MFFVTYQMERDRQSKTNCDFASDLLFCTMNIKVTHRYLG